MQRKTVEATRFDLQLKRFLGVEKKNYIITSVTSIIAAVKNLSHDGIHFTVPFTQMIFELGNACLYFFIYLTVRFPSRQMIVIKSDNHAKWT